MFISVQDLQLQEMSIRQTLEAGSLELGAELRQQAPLSVNGRALLIEEHEGAAVIPDIRLVGSFSTRLEMSCARCLEPISKDVAADFDLIYRPLAADSRPDESSISEAETEIGFYKGKGLLLEDVLREQILLAVPIREVCSQQCKGLCPHCGQNLNHGVCGCTRAESDSRWAALGDIRNKLQN